MPKWFKYIISSLLTLGAIIFVIAYAYQVYFEFVKFDYQTKTNCIEEAIRAKNEKVGLTDKEKSDYLLNSINTCEGIYRKSFKLHLPWINEESK